MGSIERKRCWGKERHWTDRLIQFDSIRVKKQPKSVTGQLPLAGLDNNDISHLEPTAEAKMRLKPDTSPGPPPP